MEGGVDAAAGVGRPGDVAVEADEVADRSRLPRSGAVLVIGEGASPFEELRGGFESPGRIVVAVGRRSGADDGDVDGVLAGVIVFGQADVGEVGVEVEMVQRMLLAGRFGDNPRRLGGERLGEGLPVRRHCPGGTA
jgi:hypothetical protein